MEQIDYCNESYDNFKSEDEVRSGCLNIFLTIVMLNMLLIILILSMFN